LKIKNWTNCIQDRKNWKFYVEKTQNIQRIVVVAPKEEEEEESGRDVIASAETNTCLNVTQGNNRNLERLCKIE
jgi:hypothetical protein